MTFIFYIPKDFTISVFLTSDDSIISLHSAGIFSYPSLFPKLLKLTNTFTIALSIALCRSIDATIASEVKFLFPNSTAKFYIIIKF